MGWKDVFAVIAFCLAFVFGGAAIIALAGNINGWLGLAAIAGVIAFFIVCMNAMMNYKFAH
jgi:hypothetical protein